MRRSAHKIIVSLIVILNPALISSLKLIVTKNKTLAPTLFPTSHSYLLKDNSQCSVTNTITNTKTHFKSSVFLPANKQLAIIL